MSSKELLILSNLVFNVDYPHCSLTLDDVCRILDCSKATSINLVESLVAKGLLSKVKGFINFYYPVADPELRQLILSRLGILRAQSD